VYIYVEQLIVTSPGQTFVGNMIDMKRGNYRRVAQGGVFSTSPQESHV